MNMLDSDIAIANKAMEIHQKELMLLPNVNSVWVGKKKINGKETDIVAVIVTVKKKVPLTRLKAEEIIPLKLGGALTDVIEVGEIVIRPDPRKKWRPAPGGVSIGHYKISAGTLGAVVRDADTGELLVLSNNHVLANSNDANIEDPSFQPGPYDGGTIDVKLVALDRFVPLALSPGVCPFARKFVNSINTVLNWMGRKTKILVDSQAPQLTNVVDCAVGKPYIDEEVDFEILVIGKPQNPITKPALDVEVQKFGRTTEYTKGKIIGLNATVSVSYGGGRVAIFEHQIISDIPSAGGDSGSLVLDMENHPVGLLFAGGDDITIMNEIERVMIASNIVFD